MSDSCPACKTWVVAWAHQAIMSRVSAEAARDKSAKANYRRWQKQAEERAELWRSGYFHDETCKTLKDCKS